MTPPKQPSRKKSPPRRPPEENGVVQLKVWLLGISPMVWHYIRYYRGLLTLVDREGLEASA